MQKIITLLPLLAMSILTPLFSMKKYPVETGNDKITCTVQPLTKRQTHVLLEVCHFPAQVVDHVEYAGVNRQTTYYKENPIRTLASCPNTIAKVVIKNNSDKTIEIPRKYLRGSESFFVSKNYMLKTNASPLSSLKSDSENAQTLAIPLFLICAPIIGLELFGCHYLDRHLTDILPLGIGLYLFACIGVIGGYSSLKEAAILKKIYDNIANATFYTTGKSSKPTYYEPDARKYTIPSGATFQDIFFVDLNKTDQDVFEKTKLELIFKEKDANKK